MMKQVSSIFFNCCAEPQQTTTKATSRSELLRYLFCSGNKLESVAPKNPAGLEAAQALILDLLGLFK